MDVSIVGCKRRKVDLDSSDMSIDLEDSTMEEDSQPDTVPLEKFRELETERDMWKARAKDFEMTLRNLEPLARLYGRDKTRGSPTPTVEMSKLLFTELAEG